MQNLIVTRCSAESRSPAGVWDGAEASQSLSHEGSVTSEELYACCFSCSLGLFAARGSWCWVWVLEARFTT